MINIGQHPSGFDYMRLGLALSVMFFHSISLNMAEPNLPFLFHGPLGFWRFSVVPMFFGLSGFLVAGSLDRTRSLIGFLGLRALRIFPALAVDTVFSAIVLGLMFTTLPWATYLSAAEFHRYFLNIVGDIHYFLPGVFAANPIPTVNAQLWTIPYELCCYVTLLCLTAFGLYAHRRIFLVVAALAPFLFPIGFIVAGVHLNYHAEVAPCFLVGVAVHLYRDKIPWNRRLFAAALLATIITTGVKQLIIFMPFPLLYVTVFLGLLNPKKFGLLNTGDYS